MGIQINGNTDNISATDGGLTVSDLELNQTGVSTFHSHLHVADQIIHLDDANSKIRFPAADTITAETAGTERLRITSSGEVKIMNTSGTVGLYFQSSSGAVSNFRAIGTNNQSLGYFFGNTERVRFASNGKVGINSTAPTNMLDVVGTADVLGLYRNDYTGTGGAGFNLNFGGAKADGSLFNCAKITAIRSDNTAQAGQFRFSVLDSGSMSEKLRIDSSGRLLVGGTGNTDSDIRLYLHNPSATGSQMQLTGNASGTGNSDGLRIGYNGSGGQMWLFENQYLRFATNNNERLRIDSGGHVGIGTDNPAASLQGAWNKVLAISAGTSNGSMIRFNESSSAGGGSNTGMLVGQHSNNSYIVNYQSGFMSLRTNNTERFRISSTGNASLGLSADAVPTASSYNSGTLHLHQPSSGSYGSQIKMTTASGGSNAGDGFYIAHWGGNNETFIYNKENTPIRFGTNSTERFVIKNDGDVSITDGNLIVASGHGISFAASGNFGTMNSEILDDYEEGYWTPTIGGHAGDGSTSYSNQKGSYVRVGGIVHLNWYISWNSTSASGQFRIYGMPYSTATTYGTNYNITTGSMMFDSIATPYQYGQMVPYLAHGVNQIVFYSSYYTGGWNIMSHGTQSQNGGSMICSISYRAA